MYDDKAREHNSVVDSGRRCTLETQLLISIPISGRMSVRPPNPHHKRHKPQAQCPENGRCLCQQYFSRLACLSCCKRSADLQLHSLLWLYVCCLQNWMFLSPCPQLVCSECVDHQQSIQMSVGSPDAFQSAGRLGRLWKNCLLPPERQRIKAGNKEHKDNIIMLYLSQSNLQKNDAISLWQYIIFTAHFKWQQQ